MPFPPAPVTVETIDGTVLAGRWGGLRDGKDVLLETDSGATAIDLDSLARVTFVNSAPAFPSGATLFHLADGGVLSGDLVGTDGDALVARTPLGQTTRLAFDRLAAVRLADPTQFALAAERFREALLDRLPGKDVLVTREKDDVRLVRGRLETLDPDAGSFVVAEKLRPFSTEKIFGVVFAAGSGGKQRYPVTLYFRSGERVSGRLESGAVDRVRVATSFGLVSEVRLDQVVEMVFDSRRRVYLSDLPIESRQSEGRLHSSWPVGVDRNVAGGPLALAGANCDRGVGLHSKGEVQYALDAPYEAFVATIGLDDAVRPRGSVVFRVLGDGKKLFDSGLVAGTDPPLDVRVPLSGVKTLTLVVDYSDDIDLSDYADWCGARLIRPREWRSGRE